MRESIANTPLLAAALVTKAALDLGGATGSALSFAFVPGFLAMLMPGVAQGWGWCRR